MAKKRVIIDTDPVSPIQQHLTTLSLLSCFVQMLMVFLGQRRYTRPSPCFVGEAWGGWGAIDFGDVWECGFAEVSLWYRFSNCTSATLFHGYLMKCWWILNVRNHVFQAGVHSLLYCTMFSWQMFHFAAWLAVYVILSPCSMSSRKKWHGGETKGYLKGSIRYDSISLLSLRGQRSLWGDRWWWRITIVSLWISPLCDYDDNIFIFLHHLDKGLTIYRWSWWPQWCSYNGWFLSLLCPVI